MPHIHDQIDYTADVFIVFEGKVLLRKHEKYNLWLPVGGHIELNEDPTEGAIREVKEETGLDIVLAPANYEIASRELGDLIPPRFMNRHHINDAHEHISLIYFATSSDNVINPAEGEADVECKWFTLEELNQNSYGIKDGVVFHAKHALEELAV